MKQGQKQLLAEMLNDPKFTEKVREIVKKVLKEKENQYSAQDTVDDLQDQLANQMQRNEELQTQRDQTEKTLKTTQLENQDLKKSLDKKERENDRLRQDLQQMEGQLKQAREETERINAEALPFGEILEAYKIYKGLGASDPVLAAILPNDSPIRFFAAGIQRDEIFRLWDSLSGRIETKSPTEREAWQRLLQFLLRQYNGLYQSPVLELMLDERGKRYDRERHQGTADCNRYQGVIEKVLLPGIWNVRKNSVERKCVVYY